MSMAEKLKKTFPFLIPIIMYVSASWITMQVIDVLSANLKLPDWLFSVVLYVLIVGFIIMLVVLVINSSLLKPLYADAQIRASKNAKKYILLSIHSLNPVSSNKKYEELNAALQEATRRGVKVCVIAPGGVDRVQGAYEMHTIYNIDLRISEELDDEDLRFSLFDNHHVIISYQRIPARKLSRIFAEIYSVRLSRLLYDYFIKIWEDPATLTYEGYIKGICDKLKVTKDLPTLQNCSDRLGIPIYELERIL